jgi:hypothetical protein
MASFVVSTDNKTRSPAAWASLISEASAGLVRSSKPRAQSVLGCPGSIDPSTDGQTEE